jgi:hypothetical protein
VRVNAAGSEVSLIRVAARRMTVPGSRTGPTGEPGDLQLLDDLVGDVRDVRVPGRLGDEELDRHRQMIEEPDPSSKHDGREVDVNGIEKPELQALLGDTGGTDHDVLVAGDLPCCVDGLRDSLRDERFDVLVPARPIGRPLRFPLQ